MKELDEILDLGEKKNNLINITTKFKFSSRLNKLKIHNKIVTKNSVTKFFFQVLGTKKVKKLIHIYLKI